MNRNSKILCRLKERLVGDGGRESYPTSLRPNETAQPITWLGTHSADQNFSGGHGRTAKEETETSNNRGITACEDAWYDNIDYVETKKEEECPRRRG